MVIVSFLLLSFYSFIPRIVLFMAEKNADEISIDSRVDSFQFKTITNDIVILEDTLNPKCSLLEFFFVGCMPCERKIPLIKKMSDSINSPNFHAYFIVLLNM